MTATWLLRSTETNKVLWTGVGPLAPEVIVDNTIFKTMFKTSFPQVQVTWGPGEFEVVYSSPDNTHKVGRVTAYTITRQGDNGPEVESGSSTAAPVEAIPEGVRVVTEAGLDAEVKARLGSTGLPQGIILEDGIPQPVVRDAVRPAAGVPQAEPTAPVVVEDAADFTMLLKNAKKTILPRRADWPEIIRRIPSSVIDHVSEHPEGINLDNDDKLRGRMFLGMTLDHESELDTGIFLVDDCSPKTRLYIRWQLNYQQVEQQVIDHLGGKQDLDAQECFQLCLEMFHDATELYLLEKGWAPEHDQPVGTVYRDVRDEMVARADFVADKDAEYGQPIRRHGIYGVVVRVFDKIARYTNLKAGAVETPKFESALDSLKDMGGYSLILAGMFLEEVLAQTPAQEKA